jgi:hypothetical protein
MVEGWLTKQTLDDVKNEFQRGGYEKLIITGLISPLNYYQLSMDAYLIFYPKWKFTETQADDFHLFEVNAYSELGGENCAHFNFFVNDSLVGDFYADKMKKNMPSGGKVNLVTLIP